MAVRARCNHPADGHRAWIPSPRPRHARRPARASSGCMTPLSTSSPGPSSTNGADVIPIKRSRPPRNPFGGIPCNGGACRALDWQIEECRLQAPCAGRHSGPAWMAHPIPNQPGTELERHRKPQALQILAVGRHTCVNGDDQHFNLGRISRSSKGWNALHIAGIGLVPAALLVWPSRSKATVEAPLMMNGNRSSRAAPAKAASQSCMTMAENPVGAKPSGRLYPGPQPAPVHCAALRASTPAAQSPNGQNASGFLAAIGRLPALPAAHITGAHKQACAARATRYNPQSTSNLFKPILTS